MKRVGDRLKNLRTYIDPPLVSYEKFESYQKPIVIEKPATANSTNITHPSPPKASSPTPVQPQKAKSGMFNIFAYILPGMASAFLIFIADQSMRDFHREVRMKTLDRQRTIGAGAGMFITGKILFTALSAPIPNAFFGLWYYCRMRTHFRRTLSSLLWRLNRRPSPALLFPVK